MAQRLCSTIKIGEIVDKLSEQASAVDIARTNRDELMTIVNQEMPFGRFKGRKLIDLPEPYVVWFKQQGFPHGKLGERLAVMYEIKLNGLERLLRPLVEDVPPE